MRKISQALPFSCAGEGCAPQSGSRSAWKRAGHTEGLSRTRGRAEPSGISVVDEPVPVIVDAIAHLAVRAVRRAVPIGVGVGNAAATEAFLDLVGVVGAGVLAVQGQIPVAVVFRLATAADARLGLEWVVGAVVEAVTELVPVAVEALVPPGAA